MRQIALVLACLALEACATAKQTERTLPMSWEGQPVDAFFARYGPPVSQYVMADGGKLFTWIGGETTIRLRGASSSGFLDDTSEAIPDDSLDVGCKMQIITSRDGKITSMGPEQYATGIWQASRCAEVFGVSPQ